jgi:hypothetical protein
LTVLLSVLDSRDKRTSMLPTVGLMVTDRTEAELLRTSWVKCFDSRYE